MADKSLGLFDFLRGMMQNKTEFDFSNPEISSAYDPYVINRWLSMCDMFLPVVAELNGKNLPKDVHYNFLKNILPQKSVFLTYIKRDREIGYQHKLILARHYKTSLKNVEPMLTLLSEKELAKIINIYEPQKEIV